MIEVAAPKKSKYPIAIFELIQVGSGSGFVREDTVKSNQPDEIIHPKNRTLINRSVVREKQTTSNGEEVFVNVPSRYIYGQVAILDRDHKAQQNVINYNQDRIMFVNGLLTVPKDGATVGLYEFMINHAQNATNENRPQHLKPIFREIKPAENAQQINRSEFAIAEAVMYIKALVTEKGNVYQFSEERIDALCSHFGVFAESYEAKISALTYYAKTNPVNFLNEAKKTEQTVIIEINHALKLKVIVFEGNTAMYVNKNVKIKSFTGNLGSDEKKIITLANFFQTLDGKESYELFKAELSAAKEANISQQ